MLMKNTLLTTSYDLFWSSVLDKIKDASHFEELPEIKDWAIKESRTAGEMITHSCHIEMEIEALWNEYWQR